MTTDPADAADPTDPVAPVVPAGPAGGSTATGTAVDAVFRRALRDTLLLLAGLTVLGVGLGALIAGASGVWGALIGVGLALVFCGTTVVVMLRTAHANPQTMAVAVMGSWLAKLVVVMVVLAVLRGQTFYDRVVLLVVVAAGTIGSALLDYRAVASGRIPYIEPTSRQDPPDA